MELLKLLTLASISVLFSLTAFADSEWAEKRVNQHMVNVGTKMYHQQKNAEAINNTIRLESEVHGMEAKKAPSDLSVIDMDEVDYSIQTESPDSPVYVDSTTDVISDQAHHDAQYDYEYEKARRAYIKKVRKALHDAGIKAEVDNNLQIVTEN